MPRMPDGTIVRSRYTMLKLSELSGVDRPAQPGALAACFKRDDMIDRATLDMVAKYVAVDDGAHSFVEVLEENQFSEKIWPFTDALSQSIRSIVGDKRLDGGEREAKINESVASFLSKVREISPTVAKQLEGLISKKEVSMAKTVEQLESEVAKATGQIETLTARAEKAEGDLKTMTDAKDKAEADCATAKAEGGEVSTLKVELATAKAELAKATEETIKVGDLEIKKSEVGAASFAVSKALLDERDLARIEKRVETEFRHVVGKTEEKALVLKAVEKFDEPTKAAFDAIIASAESMAAKGFSMLGGNRGEQPTEKQATAKAAFDAEVQKNVDAGLKPTAAMSKARREHVDLFNDAQGDDQPSAQ